MVNFDEMTDEQVLAHITTVVKRMNELKDLSDGCLMVLNSTKNIGMYGVVSFVRVAKALGLTEVFLDKVETSYGATFDVLRLDWDEHYELTCYPNSKYEIEEVKKHVKIVSSKVQTENF